MSGGGPVARGDLHLARAALILTLRQHGVTDIALLRAFETTPHEAFVPEDFSEYAYSDRALPIDGGQSIPSPVHLGMMLMPLEPEGAGKLLEIGTGSGYSAALLSQLVRRVFTVDRVKLLVAKAGKTWASLQIGNIAALYHDGLEGLEAQQPFDRILLNGSVEEIPEVLTGQLDDGGILVAAVGPPAERQVITRIERADDVLLASEHGYVRLAPLVSGKMRES